MKGREEKKKKGAEERQRLRRRCGVERRGRGEM